MERGKESKEPVGEFSELASNKLPVPFLLLLLCSDRKGVLLCPLPFQRFYTHSPAPHPTLRCFFSMYVKADLEVEVWII